VANRAAAILAKVMRAATVDTALSDRALLKKYAESDDQAAFAAIVRRHTAMVHGVCQRVLHSQADAEDACQAVFLILSTKANSLQWRESAANWLYTTARKVARNARRTLVRRAKRERAAAKPESLSPADTMSGRELVIALDDELDKLSPRYREPLVLCYLEGLTRDEAAARLEIPETTLKSQLERGRKKLAEALTTRGCTLGVALLTTMATSSAGACPPRLVESILAAVGCRGRNGAGNHHGRPAHENKTVRTGDHGSRGNRLRVYVHAEHS
jgi:RNA polymerase sigma factor (sigma-70 family)